MKSQRLPEQGPVLPKKAAVLRNHNQAAIPALTLSESVTFNALGSEVVNWVLH